jgi:hypothetical protein
LKELTFNLFLFGNELFIEEVGVVTHDLEGSDDQKLADVAGMASEDFKSARRYPLAQAMRWENYDIAVRTGRRLAIFEPIFMDLNAPANPLVIITTVVDGIPRNEKSERFDQPELEEIVVGNSKWSKTSIDWLVEYSNSEGIDLPQLFNDDYFKAIRLLFNAGHIVSSAKLLMSFIDTVAFVEFGDVSGNFVSWLDNYAQLAPVGITSTELWEYRNGLLHMTNISSRAVVKGKVAPLILFTGGPPGAFRPPEGGAKYCNYKLLLEAIAQAVGNWIMTYNVDRNKFTQFVERYDLVVSDTRTLAAARRAK